MPGPKASGIRASTHYETRRRAKVFAAGVMNLGGSALWPGVTTMLENLWHRLALP